MKVLVLGGGGREHALAWRLRADRAVTAVHCAPVTALAGGLAEAVDLAYQAVAKTTFPGAHFRRDIGAKTLQGGGSNGR